MSRRVVITGGGCISALGTHWNQILERLKSKRNCVVAMEEWNRFNQMNTRLAAPTGDIAETATVSQVLGNRIPVSTLKNYTGHTLGACGAIEAWVSINMMNEGWFCPNINLVEPDPQCAPLDYITGDGRTLEAKYIMSNNFAFGGINTSIIFKKWEG